MYFELAAQIRKIEAGDDFFDDMPGAQRLGRGSVKLRRRRRECGGAAKAMAFRASERWSDANAMLKELDLAQYVEQFEEEEMTSMALLEEIVRADGEKELMEALKEMGIKKMGHRQSIVAAVAGRS